MTREVKAHGKGIAVDVVHEMGLNKDGPGARGPVSMIELSLCCRYKYMLPQCVQNAICLT